VTRGLTDDAAERFFAVGFALEQMHNNFSDLGRVVAEWAEPARKAGRGGGQSG
ncbi:MAG: FUSC family protein, partial [Xanthobacteraceae bacterium]